MKALWGRGPSTVIELQRELPEELAESTIRTLLGILLHKGQVARGREGRAFVYSALVDRQTARNFSVRHLIDRFFRHPADLMLNLLEHDDLDEAELDRVLQALEARRSRQA